MRIVIKSYLDTLNANQEDKRITKMYKCVVDGTKKYVHDAGFDDVVIGLSGGIDSSLVAKIAVDALGESHVHGFVLPGPYSSESSYTDVMELAEHLRIETQVASINKPYNAFINDVFNGKVSDLTSQNIQARCRMIVLMAASNEHNWMLLNTANKTEVYTGYSTLYGDMAGAFAPIGDIYKTDVFKMCVYCNFIDIKRGLIGCIPENIINKPPSAELTENQTDEDSLGIDYPTLDAILYQLIDLNKTRGELIMQGYLDQQVDLVLDKVKKSEFKRRYEPPCAKIMTENNLG